MLIMSLLILVGLLRGFLRLRLALLREPVDLGSRPANRKAPALAQRSGSAQGGRRVGRTTRNLRSYSAPVYDKRSPMGEGVVQRACRGVVLLRKPVDARRAEPVGECIDGLDEPLCDVPAAPRFGDIEVF
jgi:hypothetical protein